MQSLTAIYKYLPVIEHPRALKRTYIRNFFASSFDIPLVILEAEQGYGKTNILSSVANRDVLSSRWLTLDSSDSNLNTFVKNLFQAIYKRIIPGEIIQLNSKKAIHLLIGALHELSINTIILDSFDNVVDSKPINSFIDQLMDELPPFTRLIIATRRLPNLHWGSHKRNRIAILTQVDLRFDVEDVSQYFLKVYNYKLLPEEASFIIDRTQGCPLLINLLAQLTYNLPSYLKIDWKQLPISTENKNIKLLLREVIAKLPRSLSRTAQDIASVSFTNSNGLLPICDLLDTLAERHCLVQQYWHSDTNSRINVPHEILVELSSQL